MEYAQQSTLLSNKELETIQRTQFMALRIIFGAPWNTSKTAMAKLACLESAKCRNQLLNATFVNARINQDNVRHPTVVRMKKLENKKGSLINKWLQKNKFIKRIRETEHYTAEKLKIKYEDISNTQFGSSNVSKGILVPKNIKQSSILKWRDVEDANRKRHIIRWRLGRIAYHQRCMNCSESVELSRKHALECTGMEEFIANVFTDVQMTEGTLSLDNVLNHHYQSNDETSLRTIYTIITNITSMCYNIQV
jgi:hypothetical protein